MPSTRIVDAAYTAMIAAIRGESAPNLLYLHYGLTTGVNNLILIPRFFFTEHCIEERKPLSNTARRAGWVGCNIRIDLIAPEGHIRIVRDMAVTPKSEVRNHFQRVSGLRTISPSVRGWTLAVLLEVHRLDQQDFTLAEIYAAEPRLMAQFPNNRNVRAKIRQQLQVLRDLGILDFVGKGRYRLAQ